MLEISTMRGFHAQTRTSRGLVLALLLSGSLWGRPTQIPYRTLDIGLQLAVNTNREEIHRYWRSHSAVGCLLETPFYLGRARAGILAHHFSALSAATYDYTDTWFYVGWGIPVVQARRVSWVNAVNLGAHIMLFTNPDKRNNKESEMGISLASQLKFRLQSRWYLTVDCSYNRLFTWRRVNLAYLSGGLSYVLDTPDWLRMILE